MSNNSAWQDENSEKHTTNDLRVVLFKSRNKDNKHLENFKERTEAFVCGNFNKEMDKLNGKFKTFVKNGIEGELSRLYVSINSRDSKKVNKALLHYLIDHPEMNPASLTQTVAGISAKVENKRQDQKKWLFDFDIPNLESMEKFKEDLIKESGFENGDIEVSYTINGCAFIVPHGFDTRNLLSKWGDDVSLKRDDLLLLDWETKEIEE